jgi:AmiR/NasT family two-component response regulator
LAWQRDDPTAHHVQVHQATGMILVQLGVSAEIAFVRLRGYAFAQGRRLGEVACDVVERRLRFEPDPAWPPDPPSADQNE